MWTGYRLKAGNKSKYIEGQMNVKDTSIDE